VDSVAGSNRRIRGRDYGSLRSTVELNLVELGV
jgi:hypothetical protein